MVVRHLDLGFGSGRRRVGRISTSLGHSRKTFRVDDARLDGIEWLTLVILKFDQTNQKKERNESIEQTSCLEKSKTHQLHLQPTTDQDAVIMNSIMAHRLSLELVQIEPSLSGELPCSVGTRHSSRGVDQFQSSISTVVDTTADNSENKTNITKENFPRKSMAHSAEVRSKGNWKLEKQLRVDIIDARRDFMSKDNRRINTWL
ncbi:hypothetical protein GE21DRAFT_1206716 [Neurospora crassa]|nr:hypothetical protein B8B20.280 [imported] - Neurospora crassa [Neurospora crassa]KHE85270.1 hypothetical protein GE21DRAFT_1206716 [Neurospora crassa]